MRLQYVLANPSRKRLLKKHKPNRIKAIRLAGSSGGLEATSGFGLRNPASKKGKEEMAKRKKVKKKAKKKTVKAKSAKAKAKALLGGTKKKAKKKSTKKRATRKRRYKKKKTVIDVKRKFEMAKARRKRSGKKKHQRRAKARAKKANPIRRRRSRRNPAMRNPFKVSDLKSIAVASLWAAGGYVVATAMYKIADHYAGGKISSTINNAVGPQFAPFVAPVLGVAMGIGLKMLAPKLPAQYRSKAVMLGKGAMVVGGAMAAMVVYDKAIGYVKAQYPKVATLSVIGPAFAGVTYFPNTMSGADFGMYGSYRQSPGDFGIIPSGLRGIPAGLQGVEYFPNRGMGGVQFYPEGADGDEMFRQSERDDLLEAEGLGGIPAGMNGADFGADEGQLG